jgi:hypothetical protein
MPLLALILVALTLALPAQAQQRLHCAPRDSVTSALTEKHGERPILRGVVGDAMIEIWLAESGSFSIIITQASSRGQISCMLAGGDSMHHVDEPIKPGKKS